MDETERHPSPHRAAARSGSAAGSAFPLTRFSVVQATGSDDPGIRRDAWDALIRSYWRPVYKYIRIHWGVPVHDAQDLTQGFFTRAMDAGFFHRFDPSRARFRTYLRTCLHGFVANEYKAASRKKRGGAYTVLSLDFEDAEGELRQTRIADDADPEEFFRIESARSLLALSVSLLREFCAQRDRQSPFELFERYDLAPQTDGERPTYQQLADAMGLTVTRVTNDLAWVRREFRRIVLDRLREISGSESEFRLEAIELLGVDPAARD
ncbi:MAG: sigma-70 family RNA polymerase sigma factor [Gemmatimonadetes bacterium]|nr:sigma-70 family RNA polymerase sigma factor [Gemmatimonadota bacterium]